MAQPRAERLMNLHILLLGAKRFIGKDAIRDGRLPRARPRTCRRRGVRARLRARQGRAAPDRRGDRGRQRGRVLRRRDRLPHPHRADLAARDPLRVRRGRGAGPGREGLAAGDAREGDRPGARQAQGPGRRDRPRASRGRRPRDHRRRAGLRAAVGRGRQAAPGELPLPARQRVRADHPAGPAVGPGALVGSLVRRRLRRRPRRRARLPALPDRRRGARRGQVRCVRRAGRHRRTRRRPSPVAVVPVGAGRAAGPPGHRRRAAPPGGFRGRRTPSRAGTPWWSRVRCTRSPTRC